MNAPGVRITPFHLMGLASLRAVCFLRRTYRLRHVTVTQPRSPVAPASPQILGDWFERGSIIVFVDTKEAADGLFLELAKAGYPALSLHGGKDQVRRQQQAADTTPPRTPPPAAPSQTDRDQTLSDFRTGARTLLVATSVAGRGIDVQVRGRRRRRPACACMRWRLVARRLGKGEHARATPGGCGNASLARTVRGDCVRVAEDRATVGDGARLVAIERDGAVFGGD